MPRIMEKEARLIKTIQEREKYDQPAILSHFTFEQELLMTHVSLCFLPFEFSVKRGNDSTLMEIIFLQLTVKREI